jgi:hypothetical protein
MAHAAVDSSRAIARSRVEISKSHISLRAGGANALTASRHWRRMAECRYGCDTNGGGPFDHSASMNRHRAASVDVTLLALMQFDGGRGSLSGSSR